MTDDDIRDMGGVSNDDEDEEEDEEGDGEDSEEEINGEVVEAGEREEGKLDEGTGEDVEMNQGENGGEGRALGDATIGRTGEVDEGGEEDGDESEEWKTVDEGRETDDDDVGESDEDDKKDEEDDRDMESERESDKRFVASDSEESEGEDGEGDEEKRGGEVKVEGDGRGKGGAMKEEKRRIPRRRPLPVKEKPSFKALKRFYDYDEAEEESATDDGTTESDPSLSPTPPPHTRGQKPVKARRGPLDAYVIRQAETVDLTV